MKCSGLSKRQAEIAERVALGMPDKVIAHEMDLAIDTVRMHVQRAAARLPGNARPRHKLTLWYFSLSLTDEEKAG